MEKDDREMEEMKREAMQEGDGDLSRDPLLHLTAGGSQARQKDLSTHTSKHTHAQSIKLYPDKPEWQRLRMRE